MRLRVRSVRVRLCVAVLCVTGRRIVFSVAVVGHATSSQIGGRHKPPASSDLDVGSGFC